ncbi:MAG: O-antigen ligase family protein [Salinivirgaceae bacterium]|nr:O-antigen ligase family protein [Salinivirgaceae bacterium]
MLKSLYTRIFTVRNVEWLMVILLCITALGMPLSRFLMSTGTTGLAVALVISGNWRYKIDNLRNNRFLWPIIALFLLHVMWLIGADNPSEAAHDINVKLPLLIFPLTLGAMSLSRKQIMIVLQVFVVAVVISTLVSLGVHLGIYTPKKPVDNIRDISIFISHIRLGLMCLMSVCIVAYTWHRNAATMKGWQKMVFAVVVAWLIYFILLIQAATSWISAFVTIIVLFVLYHKRIREWQFYGFFVLLIALIAAPVVYISGVYNDYHTIKDTSATLPERTQQGNAYTHYQDNTDTENGYYVNRYLCPEELASEWNKRSAINIDSTDRRCQPIRHTLVRYLTSKGLPKDSVGVWQLTQADINGIEAGATNCVFVEKSNVYKRIYEIVWEFDHYTKYGDPNGKSVCMRVEFFKTGVHILKKHLWFGVGTGDVNDSFAQAYIELNSPLKPEYRFFAHNQYLTFAIAMGLIGLVLALVCIFAPLFMRKSANFLLATFFTILFVSMLDEDSLTRQLGSIMFAMMYALTLLLPKAKTENSNTKSK